MTPSGRNLLALSAAMLLSACGLFGDDDEELKPAELIDFETKVPIKRLWKTNIGADADFLRVALRPRGDGNRIYAASINGNVVALDPESGRVDHILSIHALHPAGLEAHLLLYKTVMRSTRGLRKVDREMIAVVVSKINHCHY